MIQISKICLLQNSIFINFENFKQSENGLNRNIRWGQSALKALYSTSGISYTLLEKRKNSFFLLLNQNHIIKGSVF